jgi:hypothetical protein
VVALRATNAKIRPSLGITTSNELSEIGGGAGKRSYGKIRAPRLTVGDSSVSTAM